MKQRAGDSVWQGQGVVASHLECCGTPLLSDYGNQDVGLLCFVSATTTVLLVMQAVYLASF